MPAVDSACRAERNDLACDSAVLSDSEKEHVETRSSSAPLRVALQRLTAGQYDIVREIGKGGMATVFLAHDLMLDRDVAVKVMTPAQGMSETAVDRFLLEARTAARLNHPNIIPIYAVQKSIETPYIVMKYVRGRALDEILATRGPLPIAEVRSILVQVGGALAHAHRQGVVHRDVKPANLLLDLGGCAMVTDFGIAKVVDDPTGLTTPGLVVGTPRYMSPEQCRGANVGGTSDQYSLGVAAFEMLTGKVPFAADTAVAVMWGHVNEDPPAVTDIRADCPPHMAAAIMRMLEKKPADRWLCIEDALSAMDSCAPVKAQGQKAESSLPVIVPTGGTLVVGEVLDLRVVLGNDRVRRAANKSVAWVSQNPKVATVTAEGSMIARAVGSVDIIAEYDGIKAEARFQITRVGVASIRMEGTPRSVIVGERVKLTAITNDSFGDALNDRVVAWSASGPEIAVLDPSGELTALRPGTVEIVATSDGREARARVVVQPPPAAACRINPPSLTLSVGEEKLLEACVSSAQGLQTKWCEVSWKSSDSDVATVSPAGLVTGVSAGTAVIAAAGLGRKAVARCTVRLMLW
jgi:serine/threonine protein kinase